MIQCVNKYNVYCLFTSYKFIHLVKYGILAGCCVCCTELLVQLSEFIAKFPVSKLASVPDGSNQQQVCTLVSH
jgi:hypothetical protein